MTDYNLGTARGTIEIQYKGKGPQQATQDMDRMKKSTMGTNEALGKASRGMGIAGAVLAGGLAVAAKSAASFEKRLSGISAVSEATAKEMDQIRDKSLQLGKDTAFSAGESAQAIEELIKAGLSVKDVLNGAADATVNLAAAGEIDMPQAATIASNAMNQFGLAAKDMPKVADSIAGAANASAIDVGEFGQSLSQVGAVANLAGLSFEDTAVAIAELGNAGIKGSDAGTSLKSMLQRLQPTTKAASDEMQNLGILQLDAAKAAQFLAENGIKPAGKSIDSMTPQLKALAAELADVEPGSAAADKAFQKLMGSTAVMSNQFYDAEGNLKSLSEVQRILNSSLKDLTAEQKQATLQTLFGADAIRAAAILADNGAKGYDEMAKSMGKVSAADVAEERMNNLAGSVEQLKGSAETLGIALGTIILPALKNIVDTATGALDVLLSMSDGQQKVLVTGIAMAAGFLLGTAALIKIVQFARSARDAYLALKVAMLATGAVASAQAGFAALMAGMTGASTGATILTRGLNLLGKGIRLVVLGVRLLTVALLTNPIGLIIVAIIALVAAFVILYKKNEAFRNLVNKVWAAIKSAIGSVIDWFTGTAIPAFKSAMSAVGDAVKASLDFIKQVWGVIFKVITAPLKLAATLIMAYFNMYKLIIKTAITVIKAIWEGFWNTFGGVIKAAFGLVVALIKLNLAIIMLVIGSVLLLLKTLWNVFWNSLVAVVKFVWNLIVTTVKFYLNLVKTIVTAVLTAVKSLFSAIWGGIVSLTSNIWNGVKNAVSGPINAVRGIVSRAVSTVRSAVSGAWNAVKSVTSTVWNGLKTAVSKGIQGIVTLAKGIKAKVLAPFAGAASWLLDAGKNIIQGLLNGIEGMIGKVTSKLKKLTSLIPKVKGPERVDKKLLVPAGKWIMEGLDDSLTVGAKKVIGNLSKMNADIPATLNPTLKGSIDAAVNIPKTDLTSSASLRLQDAYANANKNKGLQPIEGKLTLDESGDAYIKAKAREVNVEDQEFGGVLNKMDGAGSNAY